MINIHRRYELTLFNEPEDNVNAGTFDSIAECYEVIESSEYPAITYPNWSIFDREQQETIETYYDDYSEI